MAHHDPLGTEHRIINGALERWDSPGVVPIDSNNFRELLLARMDGIVIVAGASLAYLERQNGNHRRTKKDRAKSAAVPVVGGTSLFGLFAVIKSIIEALT